MGDNVVIGDTNTLNYLIDKGVLSVIHDMGADVKLLDWFTLNSAQKLSCRACGITLTSLTEDEVEETFMAYHQDRTHKVHIAVYGAMTYAKSHDSLFITNDQLTLEAVKRHGPIQLARNECCPLPAYKLLKVNEQIIIAV